MTKEEAIQAMKERKKITHDFFPPGKWMTIEGVNLVTEDGSVYSPEKFWVWASHLLFKDGYELFDIREYNKS